MICLLQEGQLLQEEQPVVFRLSMIVEEVEEGAAAATTAGTGYLYPVVVEVEDHQFRLEQRVRVLVKTWWIMCPLSNCLPL